MAQRQHDTKIMKFQINGGGEYLNKKLQAYFDRLGIVHRVTPPYSHESNGLADRFNRTIMTFARTMPDDHKHLFLWSENLRKFLKFDHKYQDLAPEIAVGMLEIIQSSPDPEETDYISLSLSPIMPAFYGKFL
ncbi:retrotransposon-related protein [Curvularia clavata]|uniref:Retrotransposon-related protein n=1 Tax=Curvularia clavata TaxID=95742 RepID=A0A9Q8Z5X7_CURCL|nr:retrotransposon-related protein [Curvularia clavata]